MKQALLLASFHVLAACAAHDDHDHDHGGEHASAPARHADAHHVDHATCAEDVELDADAVRRYAITVAPAHEVALVATVSAPGHLAFPQGAVARVGSLVAGRVVEAPVRSGAAVAKGDVLFVVESAPLGAAQSDFLQKRTIAATAGPTLELAREALSRAKELHDRVQGVSLAEAQRREAELRAVERDRELARAAESAARDALRLLGMRDEAIEALATSGKVEPRFPIVAPIAGSVVEVSATLGELVGPEKDRLAVIGDASTLWAIAEVAESRLSEVAIGARATVAVPALASSRSEGRVAAIASVIEASTRTVEVRVEVPNPDGRMLPGMFVAVEIASSAGPSAPVLAVPDAAVSIVEGRTCVFVPLSADATTFCRHEVEVGAPIADYFPIASGLAPGELVVVSGAFRLKAEQGKSSAEHEH